MKAQRYRIVSHQKPSQYREGDLTVTRGGAWSGPGCHLGCGVLLYTDDEGKLVKVEGDPEDPSTGGRLCMRCLDAPEVVYNKDRILHPLVRDRADRGKDRWKQASWDEAYDLVAENFNKIKQEHGAESVVFAQGTARDISAYITRLAWSFGSPNYTGFLSGQACYLPRVAGCAATTGAMWVCDCSQQFLDRYDNPDYHVPEIMFVWGNYPLKSNADGFFGHWVIDLMKRGMKIVMIDPRVTWLSNKAEMHLRVRPGTDAALALAMIDVIIEEGLYDREFVESWCYGFEELAERARQYPPEAVEETTWVPADQIREAARLLAGAESACLQWGVAVDMTREAVPAGQAMLALFEITGNIDNPGGMIAPPEILAYSGGWGREFISDEQWAKRIGLAEYPLYNFGFPCSQPDMTIKAMKTGEPYAIHGLWLQTTNPMACMAAEPQEFYRMCKDLDFIAVVDMFMTPTAAALADVVLPAAAYPEREGISFIAGVQRGVAINKVIQNGETKSDMQINLELGRRLNPEAWPWDNVEDMFTDMLADTGLTFDELRTHSPAYQPFEYHRYRKGKLRAHGQPGFNTMTGRIELWSNFYNQAGLDPLPYFEEPEPGPGSTPELLDRYPLILTTGARNWNSFHSEHRQIPRMRAMRPDPIVEVHPKTAEKFGVRDGDWVWIENPTGHAKRKVQVTATVDPRMVSCDHGWWLPENDPENFFDVFDVNINNCIQGIPGKSGMGANYKCSLCTLRKIKDGE